MGQNWKLGNFDETGPYMPERDIETRPALESRGLAAKVAAWMTHFDSADQCDNELSRVEKAMRRNAPDLAGASEAELAQMRQEHARLMSRRWPRPRLVALILVVTVAAVVPDVSLRLFIWSLVLFLVSAVVVGPERVRDGLRLFASGVTHYWQHEIRLARRLVQGRS